MTAFDALILAGGRGERLGGADKAGLRIGGATLLDRVAAAARDARRVIVAGPRRETHRSIEWVQEDPPGGGPVAGLVAGLARVDASVVVVLAVDLPFVTADVITSLLARIDDADAVIAVDSEGALQPLLGAYRVEPLLASVRRVGDPSGAAMKSVVTMSYRTFEARGAARDCDTPEDLAFARTGGSGHGGLDSARRR